MFQQAQGMEGSDPRGAVKIYRSLARNGNGKAAKRLGEIYDKGIAGISRDMRNRCSGTRPRASSARPSKCRRRAEP
jgi:TPR repeat protein